MNLTIRQFSRYALSLLLIVAALLLRIAIENLAGSGLATYITFYPAIMFTALAFGLGPGLLATAATVVLTDCFVVTPFKFGEWNPVDAAGMFLFTGMGIFMSIIAQRYRLIRENLESLVCERTEKLTLAKSEWEHTFDNMPDLITILDDQQRIIRVNRTMADKLNREPSQCIGLHCYEVMHGKNSPPGICPYSLTVRDRTEHEAQVEDAVFGGTYHVTTTPLFDSNVNLSAIVHVARDITKLKQTEKTLQENEQRLRFHLENSPMAVIEWDRDFIVTLWTGESEGMFGWSAAETVGKPLADLNIVFEEDLPVVEKTMSQLTDGVTRQVIATNRNYTKSGEIRHCTWYNSVLTDQQGRMSSVHSKVIDITEQKRAEMELRSAHDQLEHKVAERTGQLEEMLAALVKESRERAAATEAFRTQELILIQQNRHAAMGEMIGNIAHQWRQPLNTLGLVTQRLRFLYGSPGFNKEFMETSVEKSMEIIQYMSRTIDDFRNFFSTEREKSDFRVDEAVQKALSLVEASFKEFGITVEREEREEVIIFGFLNEYAQVLLNILMNAKDALIERKIESPRLKISICRVHETSVVTITDNAGGIDGDIIDKIFDPYFTTKGPQQGTGIGLFMSKSIVENNMGGRLSVRNIDEGAEFRIEV